MAIKKRKSKAKKKVTPKRRKRKDYAKKSRTALGRARALGGGGASG